MLERWPFAVILVVTVSVSIGYLIRMQLAHARYFDPALQYAESRLATFAREVSGTLQRSQRTWRELAGPWGVHLRSTAQSQGIYRRVHRAFKSSGGIELARGGFRVRLGWVVVALERGFSLVPRVCVGLPPGATLRSLRTPRFFNSWSLWADGLYKVADHAPSVPLTKEEWQRFMPLSRQACRIYFVASTTANPLTGKHPQPYVLDLHVWGSPRHTEQSLTPLDGKSYGWCDEFRPEDLRALLDSSVAFAEACLVSLDQQSSVPLPARQTSSEP